MLGEMLVASGELDERALAQALEHQALRQGRLGTTLVEEGLLTEERLARLLGAQYGVPFAYGSITVDPKALALVPRAVAEKHDLVPWRLHEGRLQVLVADPSNVMGLDEVMKRTGRPVRAVVCPEFRIWQLLRDHYDIPRASRALPVEKPKAKHLTPVPDPAPRGLALPPPSGELTNEEEFQALYEQVLGKNKHDTLPDPAPRGADVVPLRPRGPAKPARPSMETESGEFVVESPAEREFIEKLATPAPSNRRLVAVSPEPGEPNISVAIDIPIEVELVTDPLGLDGRIPEVHALEVPTDAGLLAAVALPTVDPRTLAPADDAEAAFFGDATETVEPAVVEALALGTEEHAEEPSTAGVYRLAEGSIEEGTLDARALLTTPSPDGLVSPTAPTIEMPAAQAFAALELERVPASPSGLNSGIFHEVVPATRPQVHPTGMVPLYDFDEASKAPPPEAPAPLATTVVRRRRIEPVSAVFLVLLAGGAIAGGVMKALEPARQSPFEALSSLFSTPAAVAPAPAAEAIPEVVVTPPAPAPLAVAALASPAKAAPAAPSAAPVSELALPTPLPQPKHGAKPVRHAKPSKRSRVAAALPAPASAPVAADDEEAPRMAAGEGSLSVGSSPWTEVYVDGIKLGQTPIVRHALPAGKHELRLINEDKGLDRTLTVDVRAGREAKEYLKLGRGHVSFRVSPYGTVQMNGKTLGETPLPDMDLYEGSYRFTFFNKETRKAEVREVNVKSGDDLILKVDLRPAS